VAWLKANPGEQSFGSPGVGTLPHLFGLQVSAASGLDLKHVAYRGSAAALSDLVGGQVPIVVTTTADVVQQHKAGTIRVLATSSRQPFLPDVPTFEASGYAIAGFGWYGLYARAGTPAGWISELGRIIAEHIGKPENTEKLLAAGMSPDGGGATRLAEVQKADSDRWGEVVRRAGVQPQ
ncbi:MAG: tripartite tricarboxylate transporter substrate-binding protein, partial [Beijerinckiaceae bacterium]